MGFLRRQIGLATVLQTAFFSYSRDDSAFALRLAEDLKAAGAHVWFDQLDIEAGQNWPLAVQDALTNSPRVPVVLSPSAVRSPNVMNEVTFALEEQKRVIPVLHIECTIPLQLRGLQYADFRIDYDQGLKVLLRALGGERPAAAAGGAAASAVPKDTAADVPDAHERKRTAEQQRLEQEERQATEEACPEGRERQRKAAEEKAWPFFVKKTMIWIAVVIFVMWLAWLLSRRVSTNQASPPQTAVQQPQPQATVPQTQPQTAEQHPLKTGRQPQPPAIGGEKVFLDPETKLMWTITDNGKDITWPEADHYCRSLTLAGYSGWELPTIGELPKLYDPQNSRVYKIRRPFRLTNNDVWSSMKEGSGEAWAGEAWIFSFGGGFRGPGPISGASGNRALCVRRSGE